MPQAEIRVSGPNAVALETTVLTHGLPREIALDVADELDEACREAGAIPALTAVLEGTPTIGLTRDELVRLLETPDVAKVNTSNLGIAVFRGLTGATTVSTTLELAANAGIRVAATGGIGGVHPGLAEHLDISSDLGALARFPVAIVASGAKSILDVVATRELLETLGVPVIGYRTDAFPAFYLADSGAVCDAQFDDARELTEFIVYQTTHSRRGVLVSQAAPNPIDEGHWLRWMAESDTGDSTQLHTVGRAVTPRILERIHELSDGATVAVNRELLVNNARLAASLAGSAPARRSQNPH